VSSRSSTRGRATAIIIASTSDAGAETVSQLFCSTRTSRSPRACPDASFSASVTTKPPLTVRTVPCTKSSGAASEWDSPRRASVASTISSRDGQPAGADQASSKGAPFAGAGHEATAIPAALANAHARARMPMSLNGDPRPRRTMLLDRTIDGEAPRRR